MRVAILLCALMFAAAAGAIVARPTIKASTDEVSLQLIVPREFGGWREVPMGLQMVNPQTQELLDKLYSEILTRTYFESQKRPVYSVARVVSQRRDARSATASD